jgi:predicted RNase H-like HicB family nuclease
MTTRHHVTAVISAEEDGYVALCPELDVASQGQTVEEARANLAEAVTLFFEVADPSDGFLPPFPSRSPPRSLDQSSIRWFGPRACTPSPRGPPCGAELELGGPRRPSHRLSPAAGSETAQRV